MKICTSTLFFMCPALINIFTFVAKCVTTRLIRNFCGRYLVDKMLCGRYLVDILVFFWWSIFDKTPLAALYSNTVYSKSPSFHPTSQKLQRSKPKNLFLMKGPCVEPSWGEQMFLSRFVGMLQSCALQ